MTPDDLERRQNVWMRALRSASTEAGEAACIDELYRLERAPVDLHAQLVRLKASEMSPERKRDLERLFRRAHAVAKHTEFGCADFAGAVASAAMETFEVGDHVKHLSTGIEGVLTHVGHDRMGNCHILEYAANGQVCTLWVRDTEISKSQTADSDTPPA